MFKHYLVIYLVTFFVMLLLAFVSCGTSYNAVQADKLSGYPECVLTMNMFEAYKAVGEKSGVVLPSDACLKAIKRNRCIREVWNNKADDGYYMPDWADEIGKTRFDACMNRP